MLDYQEVGARGGEFVLLAAAVPGQAVLRPLALFEGATSSPASWPSVALRSTVLLTFL